MYVLPCNANHILENGTIHYLQSCNSIYYYNALSLQSFNFVIIPLCLYDEYKLDQVSVTQQPYEAKKFEKVPQIDQVLYTFLWI